MKILQANAGALTNFEVMDFLRSRGAANDPTRVLVSIEPSEFKVYDYLELSAARDQTRENIADFMERCKKYDLAKAEILNIINIRPSSAVELYPMVERCDERLGEEGAVELANLVTEVLPPPPKQTESEDADVKEGEEVADEEQEQMEAGNADVEDGEEVTDEQQMETS